MEQVSVIPVKYAVFAVVSTVLNLASQVLSLVIYKGAASLYIAMACGTFAGLLSKYILDKRYIFMFEPRNRLEDANSFVIYSLTGVFTTAVFWVTEIAFDTASDSQYAKYVGAVVGLTVGYYAKFHLDKRFVFRSDAR